MSTEYESLSELLAPYANSLFESKGVEFVHQVGVDATKDVVLDILTGRNLRNSTEMLTRRRLALLNGALFAMLLEGEARWPGFVENLPHFATQQLRKGRLSKTEKWLAQWMLGLTNKGVQNILRDNEAVLSKYRGDFARACMEATGDLASAHGELIGEVQFGEGAPVQLTWQIMVLLMSAVGAQTLTIRGSEKSTYGKLFERLVLGSLLSILGFKHITPDNVEEQEQVFWLSDRRSKRESDATLLFQQGKGARFDIGFIGRGNPEITLDKVSRFERRIELGRKYWYMSTIIIVDRIGQGSRLLERAEELDGVVVQMSGSYWPQTVARHLNNLLDFEHPLVTLPVDEIEKYLQDALIDVNIEEFVPGL